MHVAAGRGNTASILPHQFLASPEAQEMALTDFLNDTERQLRANGSFDFIGETIDGHGARFMITPGGLIAAGHREGASETHRYLERLQSYGFHSRGRTLSPAYLAIETRLRAFSQAPYE